MKKILYYCISMLLVLIILPLFIVKSCGPSVDKVTPEEQKKQVSIRVYFAKEKVTRVMPLEEYLKGVVAAEMPPEFGLEALKAQAVAARTYAYGRMKKVFTSTAHAHVDADVCTDPQYCQAWISKKDAMKNWGFFSGLKYWNKISRAVSETENIIITYNNKVIDPAFHSNSGGKTENAEDVWSKAEPYLRSVTSTGEENTKDYKNSILITKDDFYKELKKAYPSLKVSVNNILKNIKITALTEGGRVKTIKIGNVQLKGTEVRKIFNLKSANFSITGQDTNTLKITTIGYGHGVGMSQYGANFMSKDGASFEEIIKWYYTGVDLMKI